MEHNNWPLALMGHISKISFQRQPNALIHTKTTTTNKKQNNQMPIVDIWYAIPMTTRHAASMWRLLSFFKTTTGKPKQKFQTLCCLLKIPNVSQLASLPECLDGSIGQPGQWWKSTQRIGRVKHQLLHKVLDGRGLQRSVVSESYERFVHEILSDLIGPMILAHN